MGARTLRRRRKIKNWLGRELRYIAVLGNCRVRICGIDDWSVRFHVNGNCIGIVFFFLCFFSVLFEGVRKSQRAGDTPIGLILRNQAQAVSVALQVLPFLVDYASSIELVAESGRCLARFICPATVAETVYQWNSRDCKRIQLFCCNEVAQCT